MCTAITYKHYFGRNLDLEYHYNESVAITPRNYPLHFRSGNVLNSHFAMIGMAVVESGYPLYYEATNEKGVSVAGLNFPENAVYFPVQENKDNIAPFELIPWILAQCSNLKEVKAKLKDINIANIPFSKDYPLSPLHWLIADRSVSMVLEQTKKRMQMWEDPVGVLTNNPPFPYHLYNLSNYLNVTAEEPVNRFSQHVDLQPYSRGMGGIGIPGDLSSASRFIRAAFTKLNSISDNNEDANVTQFFHILDSVAQQRGCAKVGDGYEITYYSSCCNTDTGTYYYKTYENSQITAIQLKHTELDGDAVISYPLLNKQQIRYEN